MVCMSCTLRPDCADHVVCIGVERELKVSHNQPHLVPPMKLVFYDEMPKSPGFPPRSANRVSHWVSQGKDFASRTSDRTSLTIKKKLSKQSISVPVAVVRADDVPLRRQHFRPLELSIYLPGNRLSDLPEFGDVDFTDDGEIQIPPKALLRSRSENMLQSFTRTISRPNQSMVGERQLDYWQPRPSSSMSQRPPSSFEGLSSHPVCWTSLPGLPPPAEAVKTLSPMAEEEEEPNLDHPNTADSMVLDFPPIHEDAQHVDAPDITTTPLPPSSIQVPYKKSLKPGPTLLTPFNHTRISQWLSLSLSLSSSSSSSSTRTPSSLAASQSQSQQFYQCAISPPPMPQPSLSRSLSRSRSFSISTLASSVTSPTAESLPSMTSTTTAPTVLSPRSRSSTLRSLGKRVTVVQEEESLPEIPAVHLQARGEVDDAKRAVVGGPGEQDLAF
jgi:hypothetical protein